MNDLDNFDSLFLGFAYLLYPAAGWLGHRISLSFLLPFHLWALWVLLPQLSHLFLSSASFSFDLRNWIEHHFHGVPFLLWFCCLVYHVTLCLQIMVEDYISRASHRMVLIGALKGIAWVLVGIACYSGYRLWLERMLT